MLNFFYGLLRLILLIFVVTSVVSCRWFDSDPSNSTVQLADTTALENLIEKSSRELADESVPFTTDAQYSTSEYAKREAESDIAADDKARRLKRAHLLVASAEDPDPDWFMTVADKTAFVANPGESYSIQLNKARLDSTIIGPVDRGSLRLVVRIQKDKNEFEFVDNNSIGTYAEWISDGELKIHVPDGLDKGRLLVGLRPDFEDVGSSAIAERWSIVITAEIWPLKKDVISLSENNVVFPVDTETGLSGESSFELEDIAEKTEKYLSDSQSLIFPLITNDTVSLKDGDLVSYYFRDKPYSGRVVSVENQNNQQFTLLAPEFFEVYEIMDAEIGFASKEGLFPEHIVFRDGNALPSDADEPDITEFERGIALQEKSESNRFFNATCEAGKSTVLFTPKLILHPFDVQVTATVLGAKGEVKCTWSPTAVKIPIARFVAFGPAMIVMDILGTGGKLEVIGKILVGLDEGTALGWTGTGKILGKSEQKVLSLPGQGLQNAGSRSLTAGPSTMKAYIGAEVGAKMTLTAISTEEGYISYIFKLLNINSLGGLSISSEAKLQALVTGQLNNAREVFLTDKSSAIKLDVNLIANMKLEKQLKSLFDYLKLPLEEKLEVSVNLLSFKKDLIFNYDNITDNGEGLARVNGMVLGSDWLKKLLPHSKGVVATQNLTSTAFNDHAESITYDPSECTPKIPAKAYACSGFFCGKVSKEVNICGSDVFISDSASWGDVGTIITDSLSLSVDSESRPKTQSLITSNAILKKTTTPEGIWGYGETTLIPLEGRCLKESISRTQNKFTSDGEVAYSTTYALCVKDNMFTDPHIVTPDGMGYDYFASGDYILSRVVDDEGYSLDGYEIQARFLPGHETSWVQAAAFRVGADIIEIQGVVDGVGNRFDVYVNGIKTSGHSFVSNSLPSGGTIATLRTRSSNQFAQDEIAVLWPEDSKMADYGVVVSVNPVGNPFIRMKVARPASFAGQERGLLGNNNNDPTDDFIRRNGQQLGQDQGLTFTELYGLFGADWLVKPHESLFRNPEVIRPKFPSDVITLTPEQRELGEDACSALVGFYRESCIMDVGLTGSIDLVKEHYANTDDLNTLSSAIVTPNVDRPRYNMFVDQRVYTDDSKPRGIHYKQGVHVKYESGDGNFMILLRPPRGGFATLSSGKTNYTGEGDFQTEIEVDCRETNTKTNQAYLPLLGSLQLWTQDPLSGAAGKLISEEVLSSCQTVDAGEDLVMIYGVVPNSVTKAAVTPIQEQKVTYHSSDPSVATVDVDSGKVTVIGAGESTITASVEATAFSEAGSDTYLLTVKPAAFNLNAGQDIDKINGALPFEKPAIIQPHREAQIEYLSSDLSIAEVDNSGRVTLTGNVGSTVITASIAENINYQGNVSDSYKLNVRLGLFGTSKDSAVQLDWANVPIADEYKVYYAKESFSSLDQLSDYEQLDGGAHVTDVMTNSLEVSGLTNSNEYFFILTALKDGQEYAISDEISSTPFGIIENIYLFSARTSTSDYELWRSDGTVSGTRVVNDTTGVAALSDQGERFVRFGDYYYYSAVDEETGRRVLWRSNGIEFGTNSVLSSEYFDVALPMPESLPNHLLFNATKSSGEKSSFLLDKDLNVTELDHVIGENHAIFGSNVVFNHDSSCYALNEKSTAILRNEEPLIVNPLQITRVKDSFFYLKANDQGLVQLERSDMTGIPPVVLDYYNTSVYDVPEATDRHQQMISFNSALYFSSNTDTGEVVLKSSDGLMNGTKVVREFNSSQTIPLSIRRMKEVNGKLIFQVVHNRFEDVGGSDQGLWVSDGTAANTIKIHSADLKSVVDVYGFGHNYNAVVMNDKYYYVNKKNELWMSDGTVSGTQLVKKIEDTTSGPFGVDRTSDVINLLKHNDLLYFSVSGEYDPNVFKLWRSDGTTEGTFSLGDVIQASGGLS